MDSAAFAGVIELWLLSEPLHRAGLVDGLRDDWRMLKPAMDLRTS